MRRSKRRERKAKNKYNFNIKKKLTSQGTGGMSDVNSFTVYDFFDDSVTDLTGCLRTWEREKNERAERGKWL